MKILLADDDNSLRRVLQFKLQKQGHDVTAVEDGEAALNQIRSDRWDLLLSDIRMPVVDGVELLEMEHSREDARCCGIAAMMNCNDVRMGLVTDRLEQARDTGAKYLVTTCPKCLAHFECMKRAWSEQGEMGRYEDNVTGMESVLDSVATCDGFALGCVRSCRLLGATPVCGDPFFTCRHRQLLCKRVC